MALRWVFGGIGLWLIIMITAVSAWVTHIVRCFSEDQWGFLIAGAIAAPIGMIHGVGIWFGWW